MQELQIAQQVWAKSQEKEKDELEKNKSEESEIKE
jgi:hypothetical protein